MTNQLNVKMVLDAWHTQVMNANKLLDLLSDEQLQSEVAPKRNRGIYILGHLTAVNDKLLPLLGLGEQLFPQLNETFIAKPDKAVKEIPSVSELRKYWKSSTDELNRHFHALQPSDWHAKHTAVSEEHFAKEPHRNRLNVIISRTNHLSYHLGQLSFLNK